MTVTTLLAQTNGTVGSDAISKAQATPHWKTISARRQQEVYDKIPASYIISPNLLKELDRSKLVQRCGLLTERELSIISLSATEILERIHNRTFTSVEVTYAFCKSAAVAHQATNCLALAMFEEALAAAAELDEFMRVNGRPKGPLHGLPISVKEHIFLKGTPSTSGFIAWANDVSEEDALIVKVLREAGAVFHVKTTNPQGLMLLETASNLYGTTTNPFNSNLTPGGSSGGESALIAMRGSPLGIGTDIGGSIRVPSAFCGLFGLKPSVARLPHGGLSGAHGGMENIIGCVGPLATCVKDMQLFCKTVLDTEPWLQEPSLVELPWKSAPKISQPLKIGVVYYDGVVHPHPPITRCLHDTARKLEAAGHTVVPWDPKLHRELTDCVDKMYLLDGGQEYEDIMKQGGEPATPLLQWLLDRPAGGPCTVAETWKINQRRNALQIAYAAQWNKSGIDVLLCPANASVASAHGESTYWGYSSVFNILDYSAAVFPVGTVEETDTWEMNPRSIAVMSDDDARFERYFGKDGAEKYKGAPVSLQLVSRRYREEVLLEMLQRILEDLEK